MWALPNPACTPPSLHPTQPAPQGSRAARPQGALQVPPLSAMPPSGKRCPGSQAPLKATVTPRAASFSGPSQSQGHPPNRLLSSLPPIAEQYEEEGECAAPGGPAQASP